MNFTPNQLRRPKEVFLLYDALHNLDVELTFSVLRKYKCEAGCSVCYIQKLWIAGDFDKYVPASVDELDYGLGMFDYFDRVATIDDLFMVRNKYPHLYEFYRKHSSRISLSSITDTAFPRHVKILEEDLKFKEIYELSFSDAFISRPGIFKYVTERLEAILRHTRVARIKFILVMGEPLPGSIMHNFLTWCMDRGITVEIHDDFREHRNRHYHDSNPALVDILHMFALKAPEFGDLVQIFGEAIHLHATGFYLTSVTATSEQFWPFYVLDGTFDIRKFLVAMLNEKLGMYRRFLEYTTPAAALYSSYFRDTVTKVVVNPDFNFIPIMVLSAIGQFSAQIEKAGFIKTSMGWVLPNQKSVIPLFTYDDHATSD